MNHGQISHPLEPGTKVIADVSCKTCHIEDQGESAEYRIVEIINHSIDADNRIRYKVTTVPISQFIYAEDITDVV